MDFFFQFNLNFFICYSKCISARTGNAVFSGYHHFINLTQLKKLKLKTVCFLQSLHRNKSLDKSFKKNKKGISYYCALKIKGKFLF